MKDTRWVGKLYLIDGDIELFIGDCYKDGEERYVIFTKSTAFNEAVRIAESLESEEE